MTTVLDTVLRTAIETALDSLENPTVPEVLEAAYQAMPAIKGASKASMVKALHTFLSSNSQGRATERKVIVETAWERPSSLYIVGKGKNSQGVCRRA